ncbi:MAG: deaminase [Bacteroidota bacterium]
MIKPVLLNADIPTKGIEILEAIPNSLHDIEEKKIQLLAWAGKWKLADDPYVWLTCIEALEGVSEGNFGVGAALIDEAGDVLIHGHNHSFQPAYRSDLHAEMVVLNRWESYLKGPLKNKNNGLRLFSSLEPCPMCLTRLLYSEIKGIHYAAEDDLGGMQRYVERMPPFFRQVAERHVLSRANASPELLQIAGEIMDINKENLDGQIR